MNVYGFIGGVLAFHCPVNELVEIFMTALLLYCIIDRIDVRKITIGTADILIHN